MDFKSLFSLGKKSGLSRVLNTFPDGIIITTLEGHIVFYNTKAEKILQLTTKPKDISDVIDISPFVLDGLVTNSSQSVFKLKTTEDMEIYVEVSADKDTEDNQYIITIRNVTQSHNFMKKMLVESESSKKINRDKNAFLVKMANDLRSPLHSIDGFSNALLEGLGGAISDKQEKYLNIINKNANELRLLIDKIIDLSRLESGLYEWDFKHIDVIALLQNITKPYKELLDQKNISLFIDVDGITKRTCFIDENAIKIMLDILLDNAVKSTYLGSVTIKMTHPDLEVVKEQEIEIPENATEKSFLLVEVSDTGGGLSDSEKLTVFDPYYQLENGNKKNLIKNISLCIVKLLLKNMKGKIWLSSEVMRGSTFSFIIPTERLTI